MRRFYAPTENFNGEKVTLSFEESKHLRGVLRLREDVEVFVFDGGGNEFRCVIEKIERQKTVLQILEKVSPKSPESNLNLTLAIALLKGEKFDLAIQKAVELGITKIIPLQTKRADVKIKTAQEAEKKLERWRRIALEASKQSGRARLMQIEIPIDFEEFITQRRKDARNVLDNRNSVIVPNSEISFLFSERDGESFENFSAKKFSQVTAVAGAEGGWEDSEIQFARENGFHIITLGGRILRAETAAIVVSALLQNYFGDLR